MFVLVAKDSFCRLVMFFGVISEDKLEVNVRFGLNVGRGSIAKSRRNSIMLVTDGYPYL